VYSELPDKFKRIILRPYVSPQHNQLRYSIRVRDSEKSLRRDALLKKIRHDLVNKIGLKEEQVHLTDPHPGSGRAGAAGDVSNPV
jgi:hypothetical protein